MHTRWIETEFRNDIPPHTAELAGNGGQPGRETIVVEVDGRRIEVTVPAALSPGSASAGGKAASRPVLGQRSRPRGGVTARGTTPGDSLTAPMQGTVVKVAVTEGQEVAAGELILVLEAMKMEQPVSAHKAGTVKNLTARAGAPLGSGETICEITG